MDRKQAPKGLMAVQNSLWEWTNIEALSEKYEISIKISIFSYSIVPRSTLDPYFQSVSDHWLGFLYLLHPTLQPHNWGV